MKTKIDFIKIQTLEDFLHALKKNFDVENCTPGRLAKNTLIRTILGYLPTNPLVNEKVRIKAMNAENMAVFIQTIENNFNTQIILSETAKEKLKSNLNSIITLINLKQKP